MKEEQGINPAVVAPQGVRVGVKWEFECIDKHGNVKWQDGFWNLVVDEGLNELLDRLVKNVPANVLWYVGLKDTGTVDNSDTMASHSAWAELSAIYSEGTRPAFTAGSISNPQASRATVDNSAAKASFSITSTDDVYGAFLTDNSTKGGATGTLYGAGDFAAARSVENGDTLNVQITLQIDAV